MSHRNHQYGTYLQSSTFKVKLLQTPYICTVDSIWINRFLLVRI